MRSIAIAALCIALASTAQAQQVERVKASGANAAGACAGAFEMLGQYICRAPAPDLQRLAAYQKARDFYAVMPQFDATEINAAANSFVGLMSQRIQTAGDVDRIQGIQREILQLANNCLRTTNYRIELTQETVACPPIAGQPVPIQPLQVQPLPTQPLPTQPLQTEPLILQPYETQPLVLDPIVPAQ